MIVGILGGIGSGKTSVLEIFRDFGAEAVDADALAHEVLETPPVKAALVSWLGPRALRDDGSVDRALVARTAFSSPRDLEKLEALVHPEVLRAVERRVAEHRARGGGLLVLDAPLLLETPLGRACDRFVFVDAPLEVRRRRVSARGWAPGELEERERFQRSVEEKRRLAHFVIDNSGDLEATRAQVKECRARLLAEDLG